MFTFIFLFVYLLFPPPIYALAAKLSDLDSVISSVISGVITLAGGIFIVMLIVSGFHYLTAGSNKDAVSKARQSISMSVLGLVITVAAWTILTVLGAFLGVNLGSFTICIMPGC